MLLGMYNNNNTVHFNREDVVLCNLFSSIYGCIVLACTGEHERVVVLGPALPEYYHTARAFNREVEIVGLVRTREGRYGLPPRHVLQ